MIHRALTLTIAAAVLAIPVTAASGQAKIYPPGTDCANLPTIAERLLCGRQEFRRQSELSKPQGQPDELPSQPERNRSPDVEQPVDPGPVQTMPDRTRTNH